MYKSTLASVRIFSMQNLDHTLDRSIGDKNNRVTKMQSIPIVCASIVGFFSSALILLSMGGVLCEFTLLHPVVQPWLFRFSTNSSTRFTELYSTSPMGNTSQILISDRILNSKVNLPNRKPWCLSPLCSTPFILM